jgi:hypothetical protein
MPEVIVNCLSGQQFSQNLSATFFPERVVSSSCLKSLEPLNMLETKARLFFMSQCPSASFQGIEVGEDDTIEVLRQLIATKWSEPILARNVCVPLIESAEHAHGELERSCLCLSYVC